MRQAADFEIPKSLTALPFRMAHMVKDMHVLHTFDIEQEGDSGETVMTKVTFLGQIYCKVPKNGNVWVKFDGDRRPTSCQLNIEDYFKIWCFVKDGEESQADERDNASQAQEHETLVSDDDDDDDEDQQAEDGEADA